MGEAVLNGNSLSPHIHSLNGSVIFLANIA